MKTLETIPVKTIYLLRFFDSDGEYIMHITETVDDAYDLAVNFLEDTFDYTKQNVITVLDLQKNTDYVNLYPKNKVFYWKDIHKVEKLAKGIYYFRIVKTSVEKIGTPEKKPINILSYEPPKKKQ